MSEDGRAAKQDLADIRALQEKVLDNVRAAYGVVSNQKSDPEQARESLEQAYANTGMATAQLGKNEEDLS